MKLYLAIQFCTFGKVVLMQYDVLSCNTIPHFCKSSIDAIGSFILQYNSALLIERHWCNTKLYLALQFCTFGKVELMQSWTLILYFWKRCIDAILTVPLLCLTTFVSEVFWYGETWILTRWPPRPPGGRGSNLNSLFCALRHEDLVLSIWFGYCKGFLRSFLTYTVTKPNQRLNV